MPDASDAQRSRSAVRALMEQLMFGTGRARRFTQDTPVLPDVWLAYADCLDERPVPHEAEGVQRPPIKLLLTPFRDTAVGEIRRELLKRLSGSPSRTARPRAPRRPLPRLVYNQTTLAAALEFEDLVRGVLPMTDWWQQKLEKDWTVRNLDRAIDAFALALEDPEHPRPIRRARGGPKKPSPGLLWLMRVVGGLLLLLDDGELPWPKVPGPSGGSEADPGWIRVVAAVAGLVRDVESGPESARIYSVSLNRSVLPTVSKSVLAVKADAARTLFDIKCDRITWAVIDSGIDAEHPAFRARDPKTKEAYAKPFPVEKGRTKNRTRIKETYDFSRIELLLDPETADQPDSLARRLPDSNEDPGHLRAHIKDLNRAVRDGRNLDWSQIAPLLRVPHETDKQGNPGYQTPGNDHGTHVAGILGADWKSAESGGELEEDLIGVCPDIQLMDLRVLGPDGRGDEFAVMAALQFVRHLNATHDYVVVHGVNVSLSIPHDVANYACGRTPVCEECERVASAGVVVVAAAGNQGYRRYRTADDMVAEAYNSSSITDPGNADAVLTVGATHRYRPHTFGVSYFSSRGPTGDGRAKPDLVAPGEKITAPLPDGLFGLKDGTSMAAPHASGAAALLLARHNELVGQPARVKQILCSTATDLGRERYFQGAGMLDVLRALQSV